MIVRSWLLFALALQGPWGEVFSAWCWPHIDGSPRNPGPESTAPSILQLPQNQKRRTYLPWTSIGWLLNEPLGEFSLPLLIKPSPGTKLLLTIHIVPCILPEETHSCTHIQHKLQPRSWTANNLKCTDLGYGTVQNSPQSSIPKHWGRLVSGRSQSASSSTSPGNVTFLTALVTHDWTPGFACLLLVKLLCRTGETALASRWPMHSMMDCNMSITWS